MVKKPEVLFILFEGLADTVIDAQVLTHARELSEAGVADFEIWVMAWNDTLYQRSLERREAAEVLARSPVTVLRARKPASPGSVRFNAAVLLAQMRVSGRRFTHIHARTDYAVLPSAPLAAALGAVLVWDCRGDSEAEVDYRQDLVGVRRLLRPAVRYACRTRLAAAACCCDRALFVSTPLRALAATALGDKPCFIVPSCASERQFFHDAGLRAATRAELGYDDTQRVYVYSGGVQAYQRFDDMLVAFSRIASRDRSARLLIATPQPEVAAGAARRLLPEGCWQARAVALSGVNAILNAADVAFLLRHDTPTNRAASPTKFAEYCLTGLPVVMTPAVVDSWQLARRLGNLVSFDEADGSIGLLPQLDRAAVATAYRAELGKRAFLDIYRRVYALPHDGGTAADDSAARAEAGGRRGRP